MSEKRRALYISEWGEDGPLPQLQECAALTPVAISSLTDWLLPSKQVDFLALRLPMEPLIREKIGELRRNPELATIPILGIGCVPEDNINICISEEIPTNDLHTVVELLCELHRLELLTRKEEELAFSQDEIEQIVDDLVEVISLLLDSRIPEASRRGRRIAEVARYIGRQLGLESKVLKDLSWAAKLRELGKGAPAGLKGVAAMIHHEMEDFDGTGYPKGLQGDEIPVGARILRVAAALDGLTADSAGCTEIAMETLERGANCEFDPFLVRLIAGYLKTKQTPDWDSKVMSVPLTELQEGQTLAEDLWTRSGVKLLPEGVKLTQHTIDFLLNYRATDPMTDSVAIHRPQKEEV
jgi:hypothetical protein